MRIGIGLAIGRQGIFGAALNDVQTLVAALGGDSKVPAFYDGRYNVGTSGATVTTWDDARGAGGFAPQLVASGSPLPAWDSTNKIVSTDGTNNLLTTTANALFETTVTGRSLIAIAAWPTAKNNFGGVNISDNSGKWLALIANAGGFVGTYAGGLYGPGGLDALLVSPLAVSANRRLVAATVGPPSEFGGSVVPTGQGVGLYASQRLGPHDNMYRQASGSWTSGGWMLRIGDLFGQKCPVNCRAIIVLDHDATGADMALINAWAVAQHAIVVDKPSTGALFADGNSLTRGLKATPGTNDYATQLLALRSAGWDCSNTGVDSRTGTAMKAAFATRVAPGLKINSATKRVYIGWEFHNDLVGGVTAAVAAQNVIDCCQAAKDAGATGTVACTAFPSALLTGAAETARVAANLILTGTGHSAIDVVVDLAADARLQTISNTTYFDVDQIHLTGTGYGVVAGLINTAAASLW